MCTQMYLCECDITLTSHLRDKRQRLLLRFLPTCELHLMVNYSDKLSPRVFYRDRDNVS